MRGQQEQGPVKMIPEVSVRKKIGNVSPEGTVPKQNSGLHRVPCIYLDMSSEWDFVSPGGMLYYVVQDR